MTSNLIVEVHEGAGAFETLRADWQTLQRAAAAPPFLTWEWLSVWQRRLNRKLTPYVLCARADERLVGLLALGVEMLPLGGRRFSLLGTGFGGADYLDVLALPETAEAVRQVFFEHLTQAAACDLIELDGLAAGSPTVAWLAAQPGATFRQRAEERFVCPQIELNRPWPELLKQSKRGDNFKRRLKQARQRDGFAFRVVTAPEEAQAALQRFLTLHEARWEAHGGSDFSGHTELRRFHQDLVETLAQAGLLRFEELWLEGACVASIYGLDDGQRFCLYNTGYAQEWKHASPGLVLLGLSIEAACARGLACYDFLRGDEGYKFDWATTTTTTVAVTLARRNAAAHLFLAKTQLWRGIRTVAKTALPSTLTATLQNWARLTRRQQSLAVSNS